MYVFQCAQCFEHGAMAEITNMATSECAHPSKINRNVIHLVRDVSAVVVDLIVAVICLSIQLAGPARCYANILKTRSFATPCLCAGEKGVAGLPIKLLSFRLFYLAHQQQYIQRRTVMNFILLFMCRVSKCS